MLDRIAEELGDDLALFDSDPRAVIAVVRLVSRGRTFKASEHIHLDRSDVPDLVRKAQNAGLS